MKRWLREFLGINDIARNQQQLYSDHAWLHNKVDAVSARTERVLTQISAITPGLGRIIVKLDPHYATFDPFDPKTREESDKLANQALSNLDAEAAAREPHNHGQ